MTSTAMGQRVDTEKLRAALRHMSRGDLLSIASRAIELTAGATWFARRGHPARSAKRGGERCRVPVGRSPDISQRLLAWELL